MKDYTNKFGLTTDEHRITHQAIRNCDLLKKKMPIKVINCLKVHTTKFVVTIFRISDARSRLNCPYILFLSRMLGMQLIELAPLYKLFDYFTFHSVGTVPLCSFDHDFFTNLGLLPPNPRAGGQIKPSTH